MVQRSVPDQYCSGLLANYSILVLYGHTISLYIRRLIVIIVIFLFLLIPLFDNRGLHHTHVVMRL